MSSRVIGKAPQNQYALAAVNEKSAGHEGVRKPVIGKSAGAHRCKHLCLYQESVGGVGENGSMLNYCEVGESRTK